jgi:hypothetical protein
MSNDMLADVTGVPQIVEDIICGRYCLMADEEFSSNLQKLQDRKEQRRK